MRPENLGRGHWLCSRVHAVMVQPDAAAYHADRYVTIAQSEPVSDWDLAAALEASARAAAVAGDWDAAEDFVARARAACESIAAQDDREVIEADLATVPQPTVRRRRVSSDRLGLVDIAAQGVDGAQVLGGVHLGVEQQRAGDDHGHRLGPGDRDVEPVQVVEEARRRAARGPRSCSPIE